MILPFVSKIVLSILGSIFFHIHLKINLPIPTKNVAEILKKIELNLWVNLERINISTTEFYNPDHSTSICWYRFLIFCSCICNFQHAYPTHVLLAV